MDNAYNCKKSGIVYWMYYPRLFLERLKNHKKMCQESQNLVKFQTRYLSNASIPIAQLVL